MLPVQSGLALEELGWSSFQDLSIALCEDIFSHPVNSFSPTKDRGIDGLIEPIRGRSSLSSTVIQAKHTKTPSLITAGALEKEFDKAAKLNAELGIERYILVTNHILTVGNWLEIKSRLKQVGIRHALGVGRENIIRRVRKSPALRGMVPRLYGIGDLSEILDTRKLQQAGAMLAYAKSELDKFVVTESYRKSLHALRTARLLILLGDPAVGKSTIARCLAMASIDEFDAAPLILTNISELPDHWNPNVANRLFWIDDTFGVTQRDDLSVQEFNRLIPLISTAMKGGSRFIFTSRSYIWALSKPQLKLGTFPGYEDSKVEIDVRRFTDFERGQIVYNHVRLGDQTRSWRSNYKRYLPLIARSPAFKPEVARRLGLQAFTKGLSPDPGSLAQFVRNPGKFLEDTIRTLDAPSQAALAAVLMEGGSLPSPLENSASLSTVCGRFGTSRVEIAKRLAAMEGAFFRLEVDEGNLAWRFSHPTIGEAMAAVAVEDADLLDVYLAGTPLPKMLTEVTCAGRDVAGAVIRVSRSRYQDLITRIREQRVSRQILLNFLAYRTDSHFRRLYFSDPLTAASPEVSGEAHTNKSLMLLVWQLRADKLVSPAFVSIMRSSIEQGVTRYCNLDCLEPVARELLGEERFQRATAAALERFRHEPGSFVNEWEEDLDDDVDPGDHFYAIESYYEKLITVMNLQESEEADEIGGLLRDTISERAVDISQQREELAREIEREERERQQVYERANDATPVRSHLMSQQFQRDPLTTLFADLDD